MNIIDAIMASGLAASEYEARCMIETGSISVGGKVIHDPNTEIDAMPGDEWEITTTSEPPPV